MKKILLYIGILLGTQFVLQAQTEVTIDMILAEGQDYADQWVYLFGDKKNEQHLYDSCYIRPGDKQFTLKITGTGNEGEDQTFSCKAIFSRKGPVALFIFPRSGEQIKVYIDQHTPRIGIPRTEGSQETGLQYAMEQKYAYAYKRIALLEDSLRKLSPASPAYLSVQDSIRLYKYNQAVGYRLEQFHKTRFPISAWGVVYHLKKQKGVPQTLIDSLTQAMKARFPSDPQIRAFPESLPASPTSDESRKIGMRKMRLINARLDQ